jgi:outer membrane protein
MKNVLISLLITFLSFSVSRAQSLLTPEEAVSIALKNNYDILIARASADIDKTNNTAGNAGMLPNIGITGSDIYNLNNVNQHLSNGNQITATNANANVFTAGIALDWTLFDGGKMFITKKKLNEIEALGEIQFKDQVMQTIFNVTVAYFNIVKQKQQLESYNEVINFNRERVKILQASFNAGLSPKTDLLQAQIDLNVNMESAVTQETLIVVVKRVLNQMLNRDADAPFEVLDSIDLNYVPDKNDLVKKLFSSNTSVLSYQKQADIAKLSLKEFTSMRYPVIDFSAGYNLLQSHNSAGTVTSNFTYGPQLGGTITIPLYEGGNINRQIRSAKLDFQSAGYALESVKKDINTQLLNALTAYENQQRLLKIERENTALVKENLDISMQRLRLGQTTSLEVRQAQESYEDSHTRLINFEFDLKVAETKLKQLIAGL